MPQNIYQPVRVAVVGAGNVGATFAYTLLLSGLASESGNVTGRRCVRRPVGMQSWIAPTIRSRCSCENELAGIGTGTKAMPQPKSSPIAVGRTAPDVASTVPTHTTPAL